MFVIGKNPRFNSFDFQILKYFKTNFGILPVNLFFLLHKNKKVLLAMQHNYLIVSIAFT